MIRVHGTSIAIEQQAVLLRGPPGSGKSDLALRLIDEGALLIADDQTELRLEDGRIFASAPPPIAGLMEVRGVGLISAPSTAKAALALVVDLVPPALIERLPDPRNCVYLDQELPLLALTPFEASATAKLRAALKYPGAPE